MSSERQVMGDSVKPFAYMSGAEFQADIEEYINLREPDSDAIDAHNQRDILDRLKLSEYSTAQEVRERAEEIKIELHHFLSGSRRGGSYEHIAHDLFIVLGRTNDVYDLEDVLLFLFTRNNLQQVRHEHYLFHNI